MLYDEVNTKMEHSKFQLICLPCSPTQQQLKTIANVNILNDIAFFADEVDEYELYIRVRDAIMALSIADEDMTHELSLVCLTTMAKVRGSFGALREVSVQFNTV